MYVVYMIVYSIYISHIIYTKYIIMYDKFNRRMSYCTLLISPVLCTIRYIEKSKSQSYRIYIRTIARKIS